MQFRKECERRLRVRHDIVREHGVEGAFGVGQHVLQPLLGRDALQRREWYMLHPTATDRGLAAGEERGIARVQAHCLTAHAGG